MKETDKMGWGDKLFAWYSKDVKTTGLVLLTGVVIYQQTRINAAEDKKDVWVDRVIVEVEKRQDPRFKAMENRLDTIKQVTDSSKEEIHTTTGVIRETSGKVLKALNLK